MAVLLNPYVYGGGGSPGLPVVSGLFAWYDADSFSGSTWSDKTGNGRHASVIAGTVTKVSTSGNGAGTFTTLQGGTGDRIQMPASVLPATYTLFHVTRYTGASNLRIVCASDSTNWLSGHHGGRTGAMYHNGWMSTSSSGQALPNTTDWLVTADQNSAGWANGRMTASGGNGSPSYARLGVNTGYLGGSEFSAWQCAEVIVYDRTLSYDEVRQVNDWLLDKYGITRNSNGLALWLDAGDSSSYPGSGSTWYDKSGNARHFTIGSSVSWNAAGYMQFSGGTIEGPGSNAFKMQGEYTLEMWLKVDSATGNSFIDWRASTNDGVNRGMFSHMYYSNGNTYHDSGGCCGGDTRINYANDSDWTVGPRRFVIRRRLHTTPHRMMMKNNTIAVDSGGNGTAPYFLDGTVAKIGQGWSGRVYEVKLWDYPMSDAELTTAWDARRGFYGL